MFRLPQHGRSVRQYKSGVMEAVTRHSDRLVSQGAWPLAALDKPAGQRRAQHVQHSSCAEAPVAGVLARERPALPSEGLQCLIKQLGMTSRRRLPHALLFHRLPPRCPGGHPTGGGSEAVPVACRA